MSLQTITQILQTINTPIANPVISSTGWDDLINEHKTTYEVDPLACSVAFHRVNVGYGLVNSKNHTVPEDFVKANQIREYYSKKYFWNSLKSNVSQSEFRINAIRLLEIDSMWELTEKESGFFVKLPAFYEEDVFYDGLKSKMKTSKINVRSPNKGSIEQLTYLGKTFRWQRVKRESFWFKDDNNFLYAYTTTQGHPFNALFEERIQTPQVFEFSHGVDNAGDMWYNNIGSFTILKEQNA